MVKRIVSGGLFFLVVLVGGLASAAGAAPADESVSAQAIRRIYEHGGFASRAAQMNARSIDHLRRSAPDVAADDFAAFERAVREIDYVALLVKRWSGAFSAEEWQQIDALLGQVGTRELAALYEIDQDMQAAQRPPDFLARSYADFVAKLSPRDRQALVDFRHSPLGERYARLLARANPELMELMVSRITQLWDETVARAPVPAPPSAKPDSAAAMAEPIYDVRELEVKPWGGMQTAPELPSELATRRQRVVVVVEVVVTKEGKTRDLVIRESNDPRYNEPVLAAIRQWTFNPGKKGGEPAACKVYVPLAFNPTQ